MAIPFHRSQLASMEQMLLLQVDCLESALAYYDQACGSKSNKSTIYEVIGNVKVLVEFMSENARERLSASHTSNNINSQNNTYTKNPSKGLYSSFETVDNNVYRKGIKKVPPAFQRINRKNLKIKSANKYHIDTSSLLQDIPETVYDRQNHYSSSNMNSNDDTAQTYQSSNNNNNNYSAGEIDAKMLDLPLAENDLSELKRIIDLARTTRETGRQNVNNKQDAVEEGKSRTSPGTPTTKTSFSYGPDIITDEMLSTLPSWASPPETTKGEGGNASNEATYTDSGNSESNNRSKSNSNSKRSSEQSTNGLQHNATDEKLLTVLHSKNKVLTQSLRVHEKQEVGHHKHEIHHSPREADPSESHHYHKHDDHQDDRQEKHYIYHKQDEVEDDEDAYDIIDHIYSAGNGEALELNDDINPADIWITSSDLVSTSTSTPRERDSKARRAPPPINGEMMNQSLDFVNSEGGGAYEALPGGSTPR